MTLRGLYVHQRLLTLIAILSHSRSLALADPFAERLFFKDLVSDAVERRQVSAGEDVMLECEAAGRPSPTVYWKRAGIPLNQVHCVNPYL